MRLVELLGGVEVVEAVGDLTAVDVKAVTHDSRRVPSGALFCCLPGAVADGHDFAPVAVEAGATALLVERRLDLPVPQARVAAGGVRPAMARVSAAFYGHPSRRLTVVGVTGTNGKTTVTALLGAVLAAAGRRTAVIGTLSGERTTPESPELQAMMARHLAGGGDALAMEVSSHALHQHRVDEVRFAAAVFTNLSHDHLDYHGTIEDYFEAKASLFRPERVATAAVNVDDPWGARLADRVAGDGVEVHRYSQADAADLDTTLAGSTFRWRGHKVRLHLGGDFNVSNAVAAATAAAALGIGGEAIAAGLEAVERVPGRLEPVDEGQAFDVVVDYAHTPDGLAKVLGCARRATRGSVIVVFGCGGDRDRAKRPAMGRVATELADVAVLTSDNPRGEDPLAIIEDVRSGVVRASGLVVEPDRAAAIRTALEGARPGDVVVIAGKGHETGQDVAGVVTPFDDREVARDVLKEVAG